jgi:hypothetical protein
MMVGEIIVQFGIGHSVVKEMLKTLVYWKVCCCVPKLLMEKRKRPCVDVSLQLLQQHAVENGDFLLTIVTSDESWLDCFGPETK